MKFLVSILLIALISFITGLYFTWWSFAVAALAISALIPQRPGLSFLSGFLALFLLWGLLALVIDLPNNSILSSKIAQVLPLNGSSVLLILVTGLVGGLVGGMAALTGSFLQKMR